MEKIDRILITGATGKVGSTLIKRLIGDPRFVNVKIRALCHNREPESNDRIEIIHGSIENLNDVKKALDKVTHVVHLATCKETPAQVMDVTVKGLFWLLETCRVSTTFQQFILIGGDAAIGHFFYPRSIPVTETQKFSAYPGCYALSKVIEETMLEQYFLQYDLNGCCLRAPWIMEKDDFKYQLSFGEDVFGGPRWRELVERGKAEEYVQTNTIPVMLDADGEPIKRNFIHVEDLVKAILLSLDNPKAYQQTFNICMNEPVDYGEVGKYLAERHGLPSIEIKTPYHSTWLDNTKAKLLLDWRPVYDLKKMIDSAWDYQRSENDPRKVWYPG